MQKLLTFLAKSLYDTLTNDIVSFEQLGPGELILKQNIQFCYNQPLAKVHDANLMATLSKNTFYTFWRSDGNTCTYCSGQFLKKM